MFKAERTFHKIGTANTSIMYAEGESIKILLAPLFQHEKHIMGG
jgi:hypothetical protein